jgi:GAF domain-containing protein/anti-sigma regulatory factor (Ser/Thr protein kinase)
VEVGTGQAAEDLREVTFRWPDNSFEFGFAALNYTLPEKNQHAYRLEGFDSSWNYIGNRRFGRYTNLPGGTYTLRLKASNNDGVWNEEGTSIQVTIVPPFWQTWWFWGIVAMALAGSVFGSYRLRVRSLETRSQELETQVAERTKELTTLNTVAETASRSLDLETLLRAALDKVLEVLELESGAIYLKDLETGLLQMACYRGLSEPFRRVVARGIISARAAESGNPVIIDDLPRQPDAPEQVVKEGYRSVASIPLLSKGQVQGVLTTAGCKLRRFQQQDVDLLLSIGNQIGVAIENARLYEDTKSRLAQLTALQETTSAVASTLELEELLNLITQQATSLLQADGGILNLVEWDREEDEVVGATGSAAFTLGLRSPLDSSLSGWVTLHNQPVISNQVQDDSRLDQHARLWVAEKQIQSAAVAPLTVKGEVVGTLVVMNKQGGKVEFDQADLHLLIAFANQAATAIENARLLAQAQQGMRELEALYRADEELYRHLSLDEVLQALVDIAVDILEADKSCLMMWDAGQERFVMRVARGFSLQTTALVSLPRGEGTVGHVAETGEPVIVEDALTDPRRKDEPSEAVQAILSEGVRSFIHLPIKIEDEVFGVFNVDFTEPHAFGQDELQLFTALAQRAALAIENARLYEQTQQLAVMEERQRLARELHDSVTQALYGVTLYSQAAAGHLALGDADRVAEHLSELQDTAQEALAEMRLLVFELRPPILEEQGLVAALQARLQAVEGRAGVRTEFKTDVEERLPLDVEEGLYRIALEALNNALKHAQAQNIKVYLRQQEPPRGAVTLEVADDGIGFDLATARQRGGLGLSAMEERASELGATFAIESETGNGCRVVVVREDDDGRRTGDE